MKRTPRRVSFDESRVTLSRLERFVLSRVNGELSVKELVQLTGLAAPQVDQILGRLQSHGAIELAEDISTPALDELLADEPLPDPKEVVEVLPGEVSSAPDVWIADELPRTSEEMRAAAPVAPAPDAPPEDDAGDDDYAVPVERPRSSASPARMPSRPPEEKTEDGAAPQAAAPAQEAAGPMLVPAEGDATDPNEAHPDEVQNYRKLYETTLRQLPLDQRLEKARCESGATLMALCFDQDPQVIKGILENDRMSLDHARLIAAHHRSPIGLEAICARVSLLQDGRVQRMLLRNVQLTETLMRRVLQPKRLLEIYKSSIDRDVPDRTRTGARQLLKAKYASSAPEEKFEIIWGTEGRVLQFLVGQTIDAKTVAMFCARNITSVMLIQAFARFPATPPGILAHILKQPLVQRQVHLRNMILQHPNVPSDAKRKM